jgi:molybdenum-dependent DNA-binding transcriptional regulator ModE
MNVDEVRNAIEQGGSIRQAAKLLNKSYTSLQWWLARNGYQITQKATIEKIDRVLTSEVKS